MKLNFILLKVFVLFLLTGCSSIQTRLNKADVGISGKGMEIKTHGLFKEKVTYGSYYSKDSKKSYKDNTALLLPASKKNIEAQASHYFIQVTPENKEAEVTLIEKKKRRGGVLVQLEFEDSQLLLHTITITIQPKDNPTKKYNLEIDLLKIYDHDKISVKNEKGNEILQLYFSEDQGYAVDKNHDIYLNNVKVGAYRIFPKMYINEFSDDSFGFRHYSWINNNLSDEIKLIISSIITAISSREEIDIWGSILE